jgi:hypothetical protein
MFGGFIQGLMMIITLFALWVGGSGRAVGKSIDGKEKECFLLASTFMI